jgi:hypothetical protein
MREIRDYPGFRDNNPISKTNYKCIIGDYNLPEEICCCFLKDSGKLCGEEHKKGWVVELQDGTVSIIGNVCAEAKFGADSRLIADQSRYINEKKRQEKLATLKQQLADKPLRLDQLSGLRNRLVQLESKIEGFTEQLGPLVTRRLRDMVRTGRSEVVVTAVRYRDYIDDEGRRKRERSDFQHTLGSLTGLDLTAAGSFYTVRDTINDVVRAYQRADEIELDPKKKEVESLANRLNEYDRILKEGNRLLGLESAFVQNNWLLLCFLTDDKTERAKMAKIAMRQAGKGAGKGDANAWLADQEKTIKQRLGAESLQIR